MYFVTALELLGMLKPLLVTYPFTKWGFTVEFIEKPSSAVAEDGDTSHTIVSVRTFKLFRS